MKKLIAICAGLGFTLSTYATTSTELPKTIRPVEPTHSELVANKSFIVQRFVLANQSDVALENLLTEIKRHTTSDKNEQSIHIISNTRSAETLAKTVSKRLKDLKVKPAIHIKHSKEKNSIYPLYVELHQIAKRNSLCKAETAESHMGYTQYYDCALRHNNKIHLKY